MSLRICIKWYFWSIFLVSLSMMSNSVMVQSRIVNPYDSAGTAYELMASMVFLLVSSLFNISFNRWKYSVLREVFVVLSVIWLSLNPRYLYFSFSSKDLSSCPLFKMMFSVWRIFPRQIVSLLHFSIPKFIWISSLNVFTMWIWFISWLSFDA